MLNFQLRGNYIVLTDTTKPRKEFTGLAKDVSIYKDNELTPNFYIRGLEDWSELTAIPYSRIDGFSSITDFINWYSNNTGEAVNAVLGGGATSALQQDANSTLDSIDTKVTGLAKDSTLTDGTQKSIARGGAKGSTVASDVTSTNVDSNTQALDVATLALGSLYTFSTVNSSSAQLASGASFPGAIEDVTNLPSISILLTSDQNMTITVLQYIDSLGTRLASSSSFPVYANQGFARSFPINGNYLSVQVTNNGVSTTTTFRLDTAYGVIDASDTSGNLPVQQAMKYARGSITTKNLVPNGVATNNSSVEIDLQGASQLSIQTTGTYTGALSIQVTSDNSRWETITATSLTNFATGAYTATIASGTVGVFTIDVGAFLKARVTGLAAVTGTAIVTLRASSVSISSIARALATGANVVGGVTQSGTWTVSPGNSANTTPWLVTALSSAPVSVTDISSAALTTNTTTATITPSFGTSYEVNIPVTVVTGSSPTLDVSIEESDDGGTNWYTVYQFPRITTTGIYRSPKLPLTGNRVRYVQTVGGSTPSFTRSLNRLQSADNNVPYTRQLIDRSIVLTTLNSVTPSLNVQNCSNAQLIVNIGTAVSAAVLQLQGSDDNGATWYSVGSTLLSVASSTVQLTVNNINSQLLRAIVSTAGTTVVSGYVLIKGFK